MEVTRSNFKESLVEIEEAIKSADFLAIDGEFTGLSAPDSDNIGSFDTPEERYHKLRKGASQFLLVQFGLAAFRYDQETRRYTARPFNLYVFPRPFSRQAPDRRFLCQSSSLDFLTLQGFDFNKLFREGVSYLTSIQEQQLKQGIEKKFAEHADLSSPAFTSPHGAGIPGPHKGPVEVPEDQKDFIEGICKQIKEFLAQSEEETLQLTQCSAFQRKLIYQTTRIKFSNVHLETRTGEKRERYIVVSRMQGQAEMKAREEAKLATEMAEVDEAVGFCRVTRMISESGKLVVGHNMILDLVHTVNQFFFSLPESYDDFKGIVKCVFPRLLDTKLMASTAPFKEMISNTALGDLLKTVQASPFVQPQVDLPKTFSMYGKTELLHEAGYDAYITGRVFIGMANYLGTFQRPEKTHIEPSSPLVEPFINKLFLMRVSDIPYMNLAGPDLCPSRDHVFHVTFPKEWRTHDLVHLFAPHGGVSVSWLSDTSAMVALYKKENSPSAMRALTSSSDTCVRVTRYDTYKRGHSIPNSAMKTRKRNPTPTQQEPEIKKQRVSPQACERDKAPEDTPTAQSSGEDAGKIFDEPDVW